MLVLVVDTSSAAVTAGVGESRSAELSVSRERVDARGHAEHLAPLIAECLAEIDAAPSDLGALVAGTGPGPYTGLRVGLVTAAVMAETLEIPAYGVCSLDGIAGRHRSAEVLLAASDARRQETYWALYRDGRRIRGPEVNRPEDVPVQEATAMAGAGARLYADRLGLPLLDGDFPDPAALLSAAIDRIRAGAPAQPLTPLYLRRPDATVPRAPKAVSQ